MENGLLVIPCYLRYLLSVDNFRASSKLDSSIEKMTEIGRSQKKLHSMEYIVEATQTYLRRLLHFFLRS